MSEDGGREPQMVHLRQRQSSRGLFSPEVVDLVLPPLKFGGYAGKLFRCVLVQPELTSSRNCRCFGRCWRFNLQGSEPYHLGRSLWLPMVHFRNKLLV
jgi:hypothetical protein